MQNPHEETTATEHAGPHIPSLSGEHTGLEIGGIAITNTILSTWIFLVVVSAIAWKFSKALHTNSAPKLKAVGIDLISRIDVMITNLLGKKENARKFFPLLAGLFVFIFLANIFGLVLDITNIVIPSLKNYIRPINSDLNTTLAMGLTVVLIAQATGILVKGARAHFGHYVANFSGDSIAEKCVSFFIGWLHFAGEFIRIGSLSLRLFLNIFVGIILISVVLYIGKLLPIHGFFGLGGLLSLPFWFFELLVAFLQAYIFMTLSGLYLKEAMTEAEHH